MLPLLSSPFPHFFPSLASFLEKLCHIVQISLHARVLVLRSTGMARRVSTSQSRGHPYHHPWLNPDCSRSHDLDVSGGFLGRWDVASPTTFYPCGCTHPSPDSLCVCRREPEGLWEATPSIRRRASHARQITGPPPPAPRPRHDAASGERLYLFEHRSRGYHPGLEEAPERNE